jgi:hypothetical protein
MAGELVAQLNTRDWYRETAMGYNPVGFSVEVGSDTVSQNSGKMVGISFNKFSNTLVNYEYYQGIFTIPANLTVGTGLTFLAQIVDDGKNANDLGLVAMFGATIFNLDAATFKTDLSVGATAGAEQTATVTLSSTSRIPVALSIAIANAQLASAGAGNRVLLRLRRIGSNASDTCNGRVVCIDSYVKNT